MKKVFLVVDNHNHAIKATTTLKKAFQFAIDNNFKYEFAELNGVIEIEIDGETWGAHHSFEEIDEVMG